jgi:hypothetical protein
VYHGKRHPRRVIFDCWKKFLLPISGISATDYLGVQLRSGDSDRAKVNQHPRKLQSISRKGRVMALARAEMREWNLSYKESRSMRDRMRDFLEKKGEKDMSPKPKNPFGRKKA